MQYWVIIEFYQFKIIFINYDIVRVEWNLYAKKGLSTNVLFLKYVHASFYTGMENGCQSSCKNVHTSSLVREANVETVKRILPETSCIQKYPPGCWCEFVNVSIIWLVWLLKKSRFCMKFVLSSQLKVFITPISVSLMEIFWKHWPPVEWSLRSFAMMFIWPSHSEDSTEHSMFVVNGDMAETA